MDGTRQRTRLKCNYLCNGCMCVCVCVCVCACVYVLSGACPGGCAPYPRRRYLPLMGFHQSWSVCRTPITGGHHAHGWRAQPRRRPAPRCRRPAQPHPTIAATGPPTAVLCGAADLCCVGGGHQRPPPPPATPKSPWPSPSGMTCGGAAAARGLHCRCYPAALSNPNPPSPCRLLTGFETAGTAGSVIVK